HTGPPALRRPRGAVDPAVDRPFRPPSPRIDLWPRADTGAFRLFVAPAARSDRRPVLRGERRRHRGGDRGDDGGSARRALRRAPARDALPRTLHAEMTVAPRPRSRLVHGRGRRSRLVEAVLVGAEALAPGL